MSSRVQKGNTVFKPVVKSRTRSVAPRQESVVLESPAESSTIRKATLRPEQPPIVVSPSPAAPTTNHALSESQNTVSTANTIPTVLSSRLPPPVLIQVNPRPSTTVQSPLSIDVPTDPPIPEPLTMQLTNVNQTSAEVDFPSSSTSTLFIPMTTPSPPPLSPHLEEGSSIVHEGNSKRKNGRDENEREGKRRKTSTGDGKTSEPARSPEPRSSKAPRSRRRAPSILPFDPAADPGEDIDPTAVTMASLCDDTGHGRISSKAAEIVNNHATWKLKNREKRVRMKAIMEAKKYGRLDDESEDSPEKPDQPVELQPSTSTATTASSSTVPTIVDDTGNGFDYSQNLTTSRFNVQVRIGPNGETVIDEDSLVVDRAENQGTDNFTHVTESDHTKFVNSATYGRRFRGSRWSAEETELFYDALSQYGENYELIACVLPGRDRKACKNKFKAEDKKNPARINYCLNNKIPVDISTLSRMTGKDFSGPVPEIRAPQQPQPAVTTADEHVADASPNEASRQTKKRVRSQSQGISGEDVIVIGDADDLDQMP